MEAIEALRTRRSVRAFQAQPVDVQLIALLVNCAQLAATARNEQPWEFVAVTDEATRKRLAEATDHGKFIAQAPVCIAVLCADTKYFLEDGCAATQNLLVAAHACGLGACWVAGDKKPYCSQILNILGAPRDLRLISLVAVGYPKSTPDPSKRPLTEVLHWDTF